MSIDTEYISEKDFNFKFKNYFRDFYVYQFKNKDTDFYNKGTFLKSRMTAISILSFLSGHSLDELVLLKMRDIVVDNEFVVISLNEDQNGKNNVSITLEKPLCEIFKYLYTSEKNAFFLTGNTGMPNFEKLKEEYGFFNKNCNSPKTIDKIYRYWGQVYLNEANETIKAGTYRNDSLRVYSLVRKMAGVTWKYGKKPDHKTNSVASEDDLCVECITIDARTLKENPFHLLYNYCNRYSSNDEASRGEHFSLIYALILYFNLGTKVHRYEDVSIANEQLDELNNSLIAIAEFLEGDDRKHEPGFWKNFSIDDKTLYSYKSIKKFLSLKGIVAEYVDGDFSLLYSYLIEHKKRIVYNDNRFTIKDDLENCIDVDKLYEFYSSFANQQYSIQKRQFLNVIKSLMKIGLLEGKKEINLNYNRKKSYSVSVSNQIKQILDEMNCSDIELIEKVKQRIYVLRYNIDIDDNTITLLKEKIKENCKGWECKTNNSMYCQLPSVYLTDILAKNDDLVNRFSTMISFFSQTMPLGEIGTFINRHLPVKDSQIDDKHNYIHYKHNYIIKGLNDYNIIDLLYAIKKQKWIDIECRNSLSEHQYQHFVCFPIEVRENVFNGKQHLVFYHPAYRSIASVCIDSIDSICVGDYEEKYYFPADIKRARKLINYTWGDQFKGFFEGNVKADVKPSKIKFTIAFDKNNEKFIRARLKREMANGTFEEKKQNKNIIYAEIVVDVVNPLDMLHWMRSYTTRIVSIEIIYNSYLDDVIRTYKMYQIPHQDLISLSLSKDPMKIVEFIDTDFSASENLHDHLFNELYNISFLKFGDILFDILQNQNPDVSFLESKKQEYLESFIFDDTEKAKEVKVKREQQVDGFIKNFVFNNKPVFSTDKSNCFCSIQDLIPLTKIEIQWLNNILEHPFASWFLEINEIEYIQKCLPYSELFNINDVVISEQAVDVNEYYKNSNYADNFRLIIKAISNYSYINIDYSNQYNNHKFYENFSPAYIEYSKKDNRFRIRGVDGEGKITTINMERINHVQFVKKPFEPDVIKKSVLADDINKEKHLVIFFNDIDNIPEKILNEFSCYRKECTSWGNGKYRMILFYNSDDCMEIVIRLLGYGSLITISEDDGEVLKKLKLRLKKQLILSDIISKDIDIEGVEVEHEL